LTAALAARLLLVLGAALPAGAQDQPAATPSPTPTPAPTAIPVAEIPTRTELLEAELSRLAALAEARSSVRTTAAGLAATAGQLSALEREIRPQLDIDGPPETLRDAEADIARLERRLSTEVDALAPRVAELDAGIVGLRESRELWRLTLDEATADALPDAVVRELREALRSIDRTEASLVARRDEVLTLQVKLTEQRSLAKGLLDDVRAVVDFRRHHLFRLDSPPLWRAIANAGGQEGLAADMAALIRRNTATIVSYLRETAGRVAFHIAIFILLLGLFIRLGRTAAVSAETDESLELTSALLQRPFASSLLVALLVLGDWIHPAAPSPVVNLGAVLLLPAMLLLLPLLVRRELRPGVAMLVALVCLHLFIDLIPSAYLLDRLVKLTLVVLGAAAAGWVLLKLRALGIPRSGRWGRVATWLAAASVVLFALAAVANAIGAVALSTFIGRATLAAGYDALTLWVYVVVVMGAVTVALRTDLARRLRIVSLHGDRIRAVALELAKAVAVVAWLAYVLGNLGLMSQLAGYARRVVAFELSLGDFAISVSSVVAFAVTVWLAFKLSQLLRFVLDDDVLPRLELPRGAPASILKMTHYLVITAGFLLAVAAAGFDLSQLTIIIGALGVGIGFGLQNVVNNFVSGLILLFERPVNLGDRIDIDSLSGTVTDIGIRASVVRTWQGADVVVPNATLISNNLVNWTLTDLERRMEIAVGVAYGTSPERVLEILLGVARSHPDVLETPAPVALFTGFGASSLDFELRAWTAGDFVGIASELRVAVNRALAEAAIEIPFPQRDLHLRTVAAGLLPPAWSPSTAAAPGGEPAAGGGGNDNDG
jgi:small-conductance mechanosensitive channel